MEDNKQSELINGKNQKGLIKGQSKLKLYNLSLDSKELNDVASEFPEIVTKMENMMKGAHKTPKMDIFKIPALENDKKIKYLIIIQFILIGCKQNDYTANSPNIIIIYTDDLGYGDVSAYGKEHLILPI